MHALDACKFDGKCDNYYKKNILDDKCPWMGALQINKMLESFKNLSGTVH